MREPNPGHRLNIETKRDNASTPSTSRPSSSEGSPNPFRGGVSAAAITQSPVRSVDFTHNKFPCSKLKLDSLFLEWLSLPDSHRLVLSLLDDAKAGKPLVGPTPTPSGSPLSPSHASHAIFHSTTPPLSPQKGRSPRSPTSPARKGSGSVPSKQAQPTAAIPRFYFPEGKPVPDEVMRGAHSKIQSLFSAHPAGLTLPATKELVKEVLGLPTVLAYPLFYKLVSPGSATVSQTAFLSWFEQRNIIQAEPMARMFEIMRKDSAKFLTQDDFKSMMAGILHSHPGLEFLQETPEFQDRYAETVVYRIFYSVNRSGSGRLTLRELKRGDLLHVLQLLDEEEDINKVHRYFSYEHFYVVYCKFWELDSDHDFLLSKDDLLRYGNHSLTFRIVDRVFMQAGRPFASSVDGKMAYEDFVWFILSEEDKANDTSLEYWFRCVDLESDGVIRANEMLYFYEEQLRRMECMGQEPVLFEDILCQLHDMVQPAQEGCFTLRDLKRARHLAGTLFNILFNLNKFIAFETRDPFLIRQEREDPTMTDWDRFARTEYIRLAMEEEGEDIDTESSADVWEPTLDSSL